MAEQKNTRQDDKFAADLRGHSAAGFQPHGHPGSEEKPSLESTSLALQDVRSTFSDLVEVIRRDAKVTKDFLDELKVALHEIRQYEVNLTNTKSQYMSNLNFVAGNLQTPHEEEA